MGGTGLIRVYTAAGEENPTAWRDGILVGRGLMTFGSGLIIHWKNRYGRSNGR